MIHLQKEKAKNIWEPMAPEVNEYYAGQNLEELADILEVVFALAEDLGHSREELMETFRQKQDAKGGFHDKIFLISKEG